MSRSDRMRYKILLIYLAVLTGILIFIRSSVPAQASVTESCDDAIATSSDVVHISPDMVNIPLDVENISIEDQEHEEKQGMPAYEGLSEEGYTEEIWKGFFRLYPGLSNEEGTWLREGFDMMFMPYYSLTVAEYTHENIFGAWEIVSFDEETEEYNRLGIYACVRELDESGSPVTEQYGWQAFSEPEISTYYADFNVHSMTASVINNNTLRLHLKVDVTDNSGGSFGYVFYQLNTNNNYNSFGGFSTPTYSQTSQERSQPSRGTMTYNSFSSIGSSSPYGRSLKIDAYWDISGEDLEKFASGVNGRNNLYWAAGFMKSGEYSLNKGSLSVSNLQTCIKQASCTHSSKKYTQISGDAQNHSMSCATCGMALGKQAHNKDSSTGKCSLCGYSFAVSGQFIYILNGRTEREAYTKTPGSSHTPKSFAGYKPPEAVIIPAAGGDIEIQYEPISYIIDIDGSQHELLYDEEIYLPRSDIPGYIHEGYLLS